MNRFVAVIAAAGVVLGGLIVVPAVNAAPSKPVSQVPEFTPDPIQWGECDNPTLVDAGAECGFVEVPLDYNSPSGDMIKLAVSRVSHKTPDAEAQGPMLVNPGGPGGSGLIYAVFGEVFLPPGAGDSYDWIGFDPRGVGSSQPALSCDPNFDGYNRPFYLPITPGLERAWLKRSKNYAKACDAAGGDLLDHMTTVEAALDMESIRKALGSEQINYYGFSYGTYLGQVYGTMFPDRLRRVVFDGNVDPTRVWYKSNIDQDIAFDRNSKVYFDWVAKYDDIYHLGKTGRAVEKLYYREQAKLLRSPAGGLIGPDEWTDIFLSAAYYVYGWEDVANAFSAWVHDGDSEPLVALYPPPGDDNGHAVYLAVVCTDAKWVTNYNRYRLDNWLTHIKAPFTTWGNAWFNGPCLYWPGKSHRPLEIDGSGVESALLINETLDSATPYPGAIEVRKRFPNSVLIEGVNGTTHSGSLSGVECTDSRIVDYLLTGALPERVPGNRSDVQCEPVPQPVPSAPAAADQRAASSTAADTAADLRKQLAAAAMPN
ncbi:MAG TPA: alpha/beta hydrolase [Actinophytocola sp.]|nr:alpha/beta hydrolase [Actinophytocola sp.]